MQTIQVLSDGTSHANNEHDGVTYDCFHWIRNCYCENLQDFSQAVKRGYGDLLLPICDAALKQKRLRHCKEFRESF